MKDWLSIQSDVKATKISDRFKKGIPDFLVCVRGIYVAIELKAADKEAEKHQLIFIREVVAAGGIGGVCETLGQVKALVEAARLLKN